jgi:hypothetical protein
MKRINFMWKYTTETTRRGSVPNSILVSYDLRRRFAGLPVNHTTARDERAPAHADTKQYGSPALPKPPTPPADDTAPDRPELSHLASQRMSDVAHISIVRDSPRSAGRRPWRDRRHHHRNRTHTISRRDEGPRAARHTVANARKNAQVRVAVPAGAIVETTRNSGSVASAFVGARARLTNGLQLRVRVAGATPPAFFLAR